MKLRPYQIECNEKVAATLKEFNSTLFVQPTGCGKTATFAHLIKDTPGRALVLAHRKVLVSQAARIIEHVTGDPCDVEMGDRWAKEGGALFGTKAKCVVSTVQTQISGARGDGRMSRFDPNEFSLLILDEAHHSTSDTNKRIIEYYRKNPKLKVVGCTATPDRADEEALGQVFESVAFEYELSQAIQDAWLVPIHQKRVFVDSLDFRDVRTTAGDLNGADLAAIMEQEANLHRIADPLFQLSEGKRTIVFAVTVAQANRLAEILNRHQNNCAACVSAETRDDERDNIFQRLKEGEIQFLVNVGICNEGFDEPSIENVAMARPTKSRSLFAQMAGRGTRTLTGCIDNLDSVEERRAAIEGSAKPRCLIIDFVGNSGRHLLVGPEDILGGKFSDAAIAKVKKESIQKGMAPGDVMERLRKAEEEIKREEEEKRKKIIGKATYRTSTTNPFDTLGLTPAKPRGWDVGKMVSPKQKAVLQQAGIEGLDNLTFSQVSQLIGEIFQRRKDGRCTFKQAKQLKKFGYDGNMSFEDAKRTMDALAANGWKPLAQEPARTPNVFTDFSEGSSDEVTEHVEAPF